VYAASQHTLRLQEGASARAICTLKQPWPGVAAQTFDGVNQADGALIVSRRRYDQGKGTFLGYLEGHRAGRI